MENLILVYRHKNSDSNVYTAEYNGTSWSGNTLIKSQSGGVPVESHCNPAAISFNNCLYIVYNPTNSNSLHMAWFDGNKWNGGISISTMNGGIDPQSEVCPNLAVYKGLIYMAYTKPGSEEIATVCFDGTTWYNNKNINKQSGGINPLTKHKPGISVYNDLLYLVYKGTTDSDLYICWFNGITWGGNVKISSQPGGISASETHYPSVSVFQNKLTICYIKPGGSDIYTATFDGTTWRGGTKISSQPGGITPTAGAGGVKSTVYNGILYIFYTDINKTDVCSAWFDGSTWYGGTKVSSQPGGISPVSNLAPGVDFMPVKTPSQKEWMKNLSDTTLISEINIPGSHDAAAINTSIKTPYACHNLTITQQLNAGIRLLDVRLQVNKTSIGFNFMTCHGPIGSTIGINAYQSFSSLMDECKTFLLNNSSETILMTLKVDDWSNSGNDKQAAYLALETLLGNYRTTKQQTIPSLGSIRGKIFLYNRINSDLALGVPINFPDNTNGSYVSRSAQRSYQVYVQDRYEGLPLIGSTEEKYRIFTAAIGKKKNGEVLFNFASAVWFGVFGVYIQKHVLNFFGANTANNRPSTFGWTLMDRSTEAFNTDTYSNLNLVQLIISSNYNYHGYENKFKVVANGHDEL